MMMYGIFIIPFIDLFIGLFLFWASGNLDKFDKENFYDLSGDVMKSFDKDMYKDVSKIHATNMLLLAISLAIINVIIILILRIKGIYTGFPGSTGAILILTQIVFSAFISSVSKYVSNKKHKK